MDGALMPRNLKLVPDNAGWQRSPNHACFTRRSNVPVGRYKCAYNFGGFYVLFCARRTH